MIYETKPISIPAAVSSKKKQPDCGCMCCLLLVWLDWKYSILVEIEFLIMLLILLAYNFFFFGKILVTDIGAEPNPGVFRKMARYLMVGLMIVLIGSDPFCYGIVKYYEKQAAYYPSLTKNNQ